ncbi:MAG TPA: ATP-binding protein [Streptosporangiaceae bacterium]
MTDMHASSGSAHVADRTWPKSRRSRLELAVVPSAVRIARHWTADRLTAPPPAGKPADADLIDSAVLVVSELVTNAIQAVTQRAPAAGQVASPVMLAGRILSFADLPLPSRPGGPGGPGEPGGLGGPGGPAIPAARPPAPVTPDPAAAPRLTLPSAAALVPAPAAAEPPRVWLVIARFPGLIRIEVHDSSRVPLPPVSPSEDDDECGRGLTVVAALAQTWGWQPERAGKVVWCELTC